MANTADARSSRPMQITPMAIVVALALAARMVFAGAVETQAATLSPKLVIAHATINPRVAPLWVAKDEGLFTRYGVEAEVVHVRSASVLAAALTSGDVQIGLIGASAVLAAAAGGIDLRVFGSLSNRAVFGLAVRPGIKDREDLRGGRFGVQSFGGIIWLRTMLALEKLGLDQRLDKISILVIGDSNVLSQALEAGTIDAVTLEGFFIRRLKEKGFPILHEFDLPMLSLALVAKKATMQEHPNTVENILKAVVESIAFVFAPSHKPAVLKTIKRRLRISRDSVAEEAYHEILKGVDRKPQPSLEGLRNVQKAMGLYTPGVALLKTEDLIDSRLILKLDQSGFVDRTYRSYGGQ